jgi:hypothetical protein
VSRVSLRLEAWGEDDDNVALRDAVESLTAKMKSMIALGWNASLTVEHGEEDDEAVEPAAKEDAVEGGPGEGQGVAAEGVPAPSLSRDRRYRVVVRDGRYGARHLVVVDEGPVEAASNEE